MDIKEATAYLTALADGTLKREPEELLDNTFDILIAVINDYKIRVAVECIRRKLQVQARPS